MPPRLLWLALLFPLCIAQAASNTSNPNLICEASEICERCPDEALHQPYCQPFGNRRLVYCKNVTSATDTTPDVDIEPNKKPPSPIDFSLSSVEEGSDNSGGKVILAWESCGRVVSTERADFFEFVAVNLLFVCTSVGLVIWRSRRMRLLHARQLAARIGMVGRRR